MTTSSTESPFWCLVDTTPGHCNERVLSRVWSLDLGHKNDHWNLYNGYTQEQLRHEILSHWNAWGIYKPTPSYVPWVWALKVYLWRFPIDTPFLERLRREMGPFWLLHIRSNDDDWAWLYSVKDQMSRGCMASLLGMLPVHNIGEILAVEIPPALDSADYDHDDDDISADIFAQNSGLPLLKKYGHVLLHQDAKFYPRWRAFLICSHNNLKHFRKQKHKLNQAFAQSVLDDSCALLQLTTRTLWKGFDEAWIGFAKPLNCRSLTTWDHLVKRFTQPKTWQEQLRAGTANKKAIATMA